MQTSKQSFTLSGFYSYLLKECEGMRNERLDIFAVISVICCNVVPEHHKFFFRLVLMAHLGREVFSTLDTDIPPVCLPGSTCNLLGFF